ncbi:hypothetical protein P8452_13201 [Trifolium repens]|nr:hypothetical protein P8452_13201 [Trifolium repens]
MAKISNPYFFIVLSICIIISFSLQNQQHLSSSIDQLKSRVSLLESLIIEKIGHECGSKEEVIAETIECNIEKTSNHELRRKIEILESIIEENGHELRRKEEDIVEILESTIKKTDHEWGSMVKDIAEIKKILLEQINASKENQNDTNQELIPASEIKLLNFISNIKACIIGIVKGLLKVLACLARHATKVIKICMQLFIGLVKTLVTIASLVIKICMQLFIGLVKILVTIASLVMKIIVWLFTGISKEVILFFKFFLGVAR